jgi:nucleoid DNA-binding protein
MTKADIVNRIAEETGMEKHDVQSTVEAFMRSVRDSLEGGENVYLRGFGSFVIKTRAGEDGPKHIGQKVHPDSRAQHPIVQASEGFRRERKDASQSRLSP